MSERDPLNPFVDEAQARSYDAWFDTPLGRVVDRLEKGLIYRLAQPRAGDRTLDVGTGTGHFACELAAKGLSVTGLDSSEAMLAMARSKDPRVTWVLGRAEGLPFATGSFRLVLSVTTLEFVSDPRAALGEMYRVLAPEGRLVVAVLNGNSSWRRARVQEAREQATPFRCAHFFAPQEFVALLSAFAPPRWSSSVFISPSGRGSCIATLAERLGQTLCRGRGALLVGRVDK